MYVYTIVNSQLFIFKNNKFIKVLNRSVVIYCIHDPVLFCFNLIKH